MKKSLMSGNEAFAYGAYLAGVKVAAAYPGTPSTEIMENCATYDEIYAEWSPNEKVALEVAIGAAYAGKRALASQKMVGLNVAADPLFFAAYTGMRAGLVIVTADDPGMHSSSNEQDSRHYARFAKIPMLEPADSNEAKEFMKAAYEISEEFDTPVLMRTVTRISHSKTPVAMEEPRAVTAEENGPVSFQRDPAKFVMVPAFARLRHPIVEERLQKLARYAETTPLNKVILQDTRVGIIASGSAYQYAREIFPKASFLKLGMVYPLPKQKILDFAGQVEKVVVIEELDPFFEEQIRLMGVEVHGGKECFPILGELTPEIVRAGGVKAGLLQPEADPAPAVPGMKLPVRPPGLCPGCGHRGLFHVLNKMKLVVFGDIGCYTLGTLPPLSAMDTCGCMGASISVLHGAEKAKLKEKAVAVLGDSTFFHMGIPALLNEVYNKGVGTTLILDNRITGMTGHQQNPGTGKTLKGDPTSAVDIEALVRGLGVEMVFTVSPYDIKAVQETIKKCLEAEQPSVVIVRHPCVLNVKQKDTPLQVDKEKCTNCGTCLRIGCTPIVQDEDNVQINSLLCIGCGLCATVCPFDAIGVAGK